MLKLILRDQTEVRGRTYDELVDGLRASSYVEVEQASRTAYIRGVKRRIGIYHNRRYPIDSSKELINTLILLGEAESIEGDEENVEAATV